MRINKKRANALLGELWAQFLQKFIPKLKTFYPNKYTVIRDEIDNKKCYTSSTLTQFFAAIYIESSEVLSRN